VAVSRGSSAVGVGVCTDQSCGYITVDVHGMAPGRYAITYASNAPGGATDLNANTQYIDVDGAGNGHVSGPKYFGYPNRQVSATVDGIRSPDYTWPATHA
jgi:hypothetical protein